MSALVVGNEAQAIGLPRPQAGEDDLEDLGRIKRLPNRSRAITIIANPAN